MLLHFGSFITFRFRPSTLVLKLAKTISFQLSSKRFLSFGPLANGKKSNDKKSRFRPNRNLTGTIYHWSVILRSFSVVLNSAKRDANGFFKVLLLSSLLLISRHPVQKSKIGTCSVRGYCSFNVMQWFDKRQERAYSGIQSRWLELDQEMRRRLILHETGFTG